MDLVRVLRRGSTPRRSSSGNSSPITPLVPELRHVPLLYHASSDVQEPRPGQGVHAPRLQASRLSTRRCGPGQPLSLPLLARLQAGLRETPHEFLTRLRIERAKTLLARGSHNVTEACFEVGFSSLGSFSNLFADRVGLSPSEYRRYARSTISVPSTVRALFVPSCFFTMLYGTQQERNIREAGRLEPMVSSGQSTETGR